LLETFARQAALVLDRVELRAGAEQARLLAESERLSRTLLNSISHELRTPLAAITSATSTLTDGSASEELRRAMIGEIQEASARLNRVVGNLLDVTRLESGQIRPQLDWHDARDLVQTTLQELRRDLLTHPVKSNLSAEPLLGRFDFSLMQHALANLLLNAVAHTPQGTPIDVSVRESRSDAPSLERGGDALVADSGSTQQSATQNQATKALLLPDGDGASPLRTPRESDTPRELLISVADRGPGIPSEVLPRIFDKFFRVTGSPAGGSGLGLTIVKGFVEAHGGSVMAENRPSGGAIFTLRLPQAEKPPTIEVTA
jgi:two-component system sensor histidine kinase KdpD